MNYDLTPEQLELRDEVRDFADTVVAPAAYQYDTERRLPMEIIAQMGELGLFGLPFPTEYGGQGGDYVDLCLAIEALARVDQSIAVTLEAGVGLGIMPIYPLRHRGAEAALAARPARRAARSPGFGLTEAEPGSDAGGTETTAVLDGRRVGHQRHQAVHHQLRHADHQRRHDHRRHRREEGQGRHRQEGADLLSSCRPTPPASPPSPSYDKVGWHTSDTHPLTLNDVRVPGGEPARRARPRLRELPAVLDEGRIAFAALCAGAAQGCLEEALRYAKERNVFGQPIGENQYIAFKIAKMQARAHTARLAFLDAARKMVAGMPFQDRGIDRQDGHERSRHGQRPRRDADLGRLRVPERERGRAALP